MPSDDIETLLQHDFNALADRLENDRFEQRLLFRLKAKERARLGVIALAGGIGAAFAAAQFASLGRFVAPYLASASPDLLASDMPTQIAGSLLLAAAVIATALVLRQDA